MNLVDSCGWLEYFADAPNADFYAPAIEDIQNLIVPTICILEVFKRILQQRNEDSALQAVALMHQGLIVDLTSSIALDAAKVGIQSNYPLPTVSYWPLPAPMPPSSGLRMRISRVSKASGI